MVNIFISLTISILNTVIAYVNMYLIQRIGYHYKSLTLKFVITFVFASQFINTGILLLLTNANFDNTILSFIPVRNKFKDFSSVWYLTIGRSVVTTMVIACVMPYVKFVTDYSKKLIFRIWDSNCTCCRKVPKTKKITVQQYVNLYEGK